MDQADSARLLEIVESMRAAQKAYFKDRTHVALEDSKRLEKLCDQMVREIRDKQAGNTRPSLF